MDSTWNISTQWDFRTEKSDPIRYGPFQMSFTDLLEFLWGHYLMTAIYVLNRVPSKTAPTTLYKIWHGKKLSLSHLRIWVVRLMSRDSRQIS